MMKIVCRHYNYGARKLNGIKYEEEKKMYRVWFSQQEWNEVRRIKNKKWVELGYVHWNDNKC